MNYQFQGLIASAALMLATGACTDLPSASDLPADATAATLQAEPAEANAQGKMRGHASVVEVIARHEGSDYVFDLSATEVPAGWTTFDFSNQTHTTHFVYLAKVPEYAESVTLEQWVENVTVPFQRVMDLLNAGDANPFAPFDDMAPYFFEATPSGGPGFTGGFIDSRTTVNLAPGVYVLECYVKNADGVFHSSIGMIEMLTVTEEENGAPEPSGSLGVTVSTSGIEMEGRVRPGAQTIEVQWADQQTYAHFLGHDVHLIRLDDDLDASEVADWMNWMLPEGLESSRWSTLGPATFIGGVQTMSAGSTGYFDVNLKPGRYAWVSEVPADAGMWLAFDVPSGPGNSGR